MQSVFEGTLNTFQVMKRFFPLIFISLIGFQTANSQTDKIQGKPIAEIFTDFHYAINDSSKFTGFDLNRAYLGYKFMPEGDFYATVIVNVGISARPCTGINTETICIFQGSVNCLY